MDIEPFWALGGWLFFLLSNCMAKPKTSPSSSSSSSSPIISQKIIISKKSHTLLQFLALLFILFILINFSHTPSSMASLDPTKSSQSTMSSSSTSSSSSTTTNLHPHKTQINSHSSSEKSGRDQFGAEAHEVPSGPNPIQN